jgi:glycerophosphoryl diester phosphodiesterase
MVSHGARRDATPMRAQLSARCERFAVLGASAIAIAVAAAGCDGSEPVVEVARCPVLADQPGALTPLAEQGFVAHAGGSPTGLTQLDPYSNSREAFEASYANGFRAFELDLLTLADGEIVVAHDADEYRYSLHVGFAALTRPQVEGSRWQDRYPILFGDDLIELMVEHPDIWVILDTKVDHAAIARGLLALAPDDSVRDRLVPHLASEEHVAELAALYPFPERMIATYRWPGDDDELLERMDRLGIDDVMMWFDRRWTEDTQARMDQAGHHVWVHTPPEPAQLESFRGRGVGVYSDGFITCPAP